MSRGGHFEITFGLFVERDKSPHCILCLGHPCWLELAPLLCDRESLIEPFLKKYSFKTFTLTSNRDHSKRSTDSTLSLSSVVCEEAIIKGSQNDNRKMRQHVYFILAHTVKIKL